MPNDYDTTTKFKVDISELKSAMQDAKRAITLANSEFKAISSSMEDWSKNTDGLSAKLNQLKSNLSSQETILDSLEKQYELTVEQMGEGSKEADKLKIAINNQQAVINSTKREIDKYEGALVDVANAENDTSDESDELSRNLEDLKDSSEKAGDGFTVMKGALANLVAEGIRATIDALKDLASTVVEVGSGFSSSMSEVQAISGASAEELAELEATAREFGATTVFSASESADALKYMALAGWSVEESTSALGGVLNLASASGMGLAQASDMVTDYLSAFGLQAQDSAMFADMLAYAQSNSNTSAEQLGEAFKNCSAVLNAGGQDVQTTTALLASMANQGLKGSEAGTALTAIMRDMTAKMKDGAIAIGDTNVEVMDAEGNYRDLTDILKDVESATNGMGDAEKATALMSTFTSDSIKGLNLILNDGVSNAEDFEKSLRESGGSAEKMSKIMNDNLAGDVKAFKSALEELALKVYDKFEPALRDIIAFVQSLATSFNEWLADPENQKAIDELGAKLTEFVEGALTTVMDLIKWFIENKDSVIAGLKAIGAGFAVFKIAGVITGLVTAFTTLSTVVTTLFTAIKTGTTIMKALNLAFGLTPIGLITTALTLLVAGFVYLWNTSDEFREFWINLWEKIRVGAGVVVEAIVGFFTKTIPEALAKMSEYLRALPENFQTWLTNTKARVVTWCGEVVEKAKALGSDFVKKIIEFVKKLPENFQTWLTNTIKKVATWSADMLSKAQSTASNFIDKIISFVKKLPEDVASWLSKVITKVVKWGTDLASEGKKSAQELFDKIIEKVEEIPDELESIGKNIVEGLWNGINNKVTWLKNKVTEFCSSIGTSIKDFFGIHSPSKLMADEVGKWIPAGIAVGIDKNAKTVVDSMRDLTAMTVGATRDGLVEDGITGGLGGVVNNFYQTNNSPKALSRLEIYRQSKNLLGYAGGGF